MEIFGFEWTQADVAAFFDRARAFALPRIGVSVGILLLAAVTHKGASFFVRRLASRFVQRTATEVDDAILQAVRRGFLISIWFWAGWRVAIAWELPGVARTVGAVWIAALSLPVAGLVSKALEYVERKAGRGVITPLDETALPLLNRIVQFVVLAVGVLVALDFLGINITAVLAGAGVVGLAVGFAAQDTLSNLIAGVVLIMDRPFRVGDRIELWTAPGETGSWGDVIEIGLRATKIRNPDNIVIVIPNNEIMRRDIANYSASGAHIRLRVPIGIAYDADLSRAKALILESVEGVEAVQSDPAPVVIVRAFGDSSVNLELRVWIREARDRRIVADEITERVKGTFDREGIEIPYPKRDVYLKGLEGVGLSLALRPRGIEAAGPPAESDPPSSSRSTESAP